MDKTAIKNFAIWARKKLIGDISYKASLLGITPDGIRFALPQSTREIEFYDIGLQEPYAISGKEIEQRRHLAELIRQKEQSSDYATAYNSVIEEVAYTWFNRLIAVRFMEVNDYLPSHTRILSSDSKNKLEPDIVTNPFDIELTFTEKEKEQIIQWQHENAMDSLFMLLFIKACNALNELLPQLFEKTADYTELLLNLSVTDREGVVYRLVNDIPEEDFDVEQGGQVEIIGWLYQYYNAELKDETFALLKKNVKVTKERIPSATQLFTPDWIVRYMVENSLGRLWLDGHPNDELKYNWNYYLEEAEQETDVEEQLKEIRKEYASLHPEEIRCMDPCMGSGHILVYMFDVLLQIYGACGYATQEAVASIVQNNLWGLDIDERATQLAYFAVMMKARQYDRRFLSRGIVPHLYAIHESNALGGTYEYDMGDFLNSKEYQETLNYLLDAFIDAKELGSIIQLENRDYKGLKRAWKSSAEATANTFNLTLWQYAVASEIPYLIDQAIVLTQKYHIVVTNPPYMSNRGMSSKTLEYVKEHYYNEKSDMFSIFTKQSDNLCLNNGFYSLITQPSILFLSSFEKLRRDITETKCIETIIHMGRGIFGIDFGSTSFVIRKSMIVNMKGRYFRLHERTFQYIEPDDIKKLYFMAARDKNAVFNFSTYIAKDGMENISQNNEDNETTNEELKLHFVTNQKNFLRLPGCPFAYWATDKMIETFSFRKIKDIANPKQGMATGDNNRFLRMWNEVSIDRCGFGYESREAALSSGKKWFPYNKGGDFRKWYGNNEYFVNWEADGYEICNFKDEKGKLRSRPQNVQFYFLPSLTWSFVSSTSFGVRFSPKGALFDIGGSSVFPKKEDMLYLLGFLGSKLSLEYMKIQNPTMNFQVGNVANLPIIESKNNRCTIENLVKESISISKNDWDSFETSWDFQSHPLTPLSFELREQLVTGMHSDEKGKSVSLLSYLFYQWKQECEQRFNHLKENEEKLNRIFIDIYGLQDELTPNVEDKDVTVRKADLQRDIRSLISYAVGCMFGRYSIDRSGLAYAGGEWDYESYTTFKPDEDNVVPITDEEYFDDDIVGVFCKWLATVYGKDTLEENLDFIARALGNSGNTSREIIRNYFLKDFYKDHCKIYQKRPIYWLFDSGKQNGFKALIYLHRYNRDTIGNMRAEYLHRMEHVYESEINRMNALAEQSEVQREAANARKRAEKLQKQLQECREYDEKVGHLAVDRIELDLDDGVKVNYEKLQTDRNGNKYQILAKI